MLQLIDQMLVSGLQWGGGGLGEETFGSLKESMLVRKGRGAGVVRLGLEVIGKKREFSS